MRPRLSLPVRWPTGCLNRPRPSARQTPSARCRKQNTLVAWAHGVRHAVGRGTRPSATRRHARRRAKRGAARAGRPTVLSDGPRSQLQQLAKPSSGKRARACASGRCDGHACGSWSDSSDCGCIRGSDRRPVDGFIRFDGPAIAQPPRRRDLGDVATEMDRRCLDSGATGDDLLVIWNPNRATRQIGHDTPVCGTAGRASDEVEPSLGNVVAERISCRQEIADNSFHGRSGELPRRHIGSEPAQRA